MWPSGPSVLEAAIALAAASLGWLTSAAALRTERARVAELLDLLSARAAPAEYAAYKAPEPDRTDWLFTEDGLVSVPVE